MTCIVGLEHEGKVFIGGDSAGADACGDIRCVSDPKVFHNGEFLIGYSASFRMGQIMQYVFLPPERPENTSDQQYMVRDVAASIRATLKAQGFDEGPSLLIGYRGKLYNVCADFQVSRAIDGYMAIGSGENVALGSMFATPKKPPMARIKLALQAATHHNNGVRPPYIILTSS